MSARVYYDRDCGFCRWTLAWLLRLDRRRRLRPVAIQDAEGERDLADLGAARLEAWHVVGDDGVPPQRRARLRAGARGAARPARARAARALGWSSPWFPLYRWVADHRVELSRLVPAGAKRRADALVAERSRHPVR